MRALRAGEDVLASGGERVGEVQRIVVDEAAHRVTHLVVDGRVVPIARFRDAGPDGLALTEDRAAFEKEQGFRDSRFDEPGEHWRAPAGFQLGQFLATAGAIFAQGPYLPPTEVELDPLARAHEVTAGSPVWSGEVRLGEVTRVLADDSGRVAGIVVRREGLLGHQVVVPAARVTEVVGNNVHTDLDRPALESLERYREG
ncbi:MAG: PRC-barrel domain-containing protein [Candidatus Dormibacteraceae bacterium]